MGSQKKSPVLIANRGEIAIRIARACRELGFPSVAVYSEADRNSEHIFACDEAIYLGGTEPRENYLNVERVIAAARKAKAKYVHPGYGFLSERAHFVEACEKEGLIFVGPTASSMKQMGDKIEARKTIDQLGIPRIPGSQGAVLTAQEAIQFGKQVSFPILLKASAGGGGKGMRKVERESDVAAAFEGAAREALSAFGDGTLYVEKFIENPHHVEIQVFGDGKGKAIHLWERECSIQRRNQKVWEETPAPILEKFPETRPKMCQAAIKIAESIRYAGAGTLEFIVDSKGSFYFLEMNTRLQVEHPVTEWVTGVDLVHWQLELASGTFKLPTSEIPTRGASIEVRIYAEDSFQFLPSPGEIGLIEFPQGPGIRVDSSFTRRGVVSRFYDPMIAKLSVYGANRIQALQRLERALNETRILPPIDFRTGQRIGSLKTNLFFLRKLVKNKNVIKGDTTTFLVHENPELTKPESSSLSSEALAAIGLYELLQKQTQIFTQNEIQYSPWQRQSLLDGIRN